MNKHCIIPLLSALLLLAGCRPEAVWSDGDINIRMEVRTISAGFVECSFSTDREAYYLIAIEEARDDYDPMLHQKQFMTLAIDSVNLNYIAWRNRVLKEGVFNVADFASHSLQYGAVNHVFTGLLPETDYWIYAFSVNPKTLAPIGRLNLVSVKTDSSSVVDVHFDYRVTGEWDYIYPLDSAGNILTRFPYVATTCDSLELTPEALEMDEEVPPQAYFYIWILDQFIFPDQADVFYGVKAIHNDGVDSHAVFQEGHTYYTCIGGYDGSFRQVTVYRFRWEGEQTRLYFRDTDPANIMRTPGGGWWWDEN